jgi:pimeloyl-ACP methyl ester carboxylesterase
MFRYLLLIAVLAQLAIAPAVLAASRFLATRPGVTVRVQVLVPDGATAMVVLLEGGGGRVRDPSQGFAHLAHRRFARAGVAAALVDAPSDQRSFMGGMHPRFRASADHIVDLDAVVAALRVQTGLPVWIAGVSLGSRSAASYAYQRADRIAGVVLLSSSTNPPRGIGVDAFPLHRITVPLLAVAHRDDRCPGTPPAGAQRIVAAATASPNAVVRTFTGGRNAGVNACGVETHHTYYGIEDAVVSAIAEFIASNTR